MKKIILIVSLLIVTFEVMAADFKKIGFPMQFHIESGIRSVDACMLVEEKDISKDWMELKLGNRLEVIRTLRNVIDSMVSKDRDRLYELSHDIDGRDSKKFDEQVTAFFSQFERVSVVDVPKVYEFDDLRVYFVKFEYKNKFYFAPFIFKYQSNMKFGFLPYRTESLSYHLLQDWFLRFWTVSDSIDPEYCSPEDLRNKNYQIPLLSEAEKESSNTLYKPSSLLVKGSFIKKINKTEQNKIMGFFEELNKNLLKEDLTEYTKMFTLEGGNRLKEWFASVDTDQIEFYKKSIKDQKPFFMFDLGSIYVIYTRSAERGIMVIYLMNNENNVLKWVNSSHLTRADAVFKNDFLLKSAELKVPFGNFKK